MFKYDDHEEYAICTEGSDPEGCTNCGEEVETFGLCHNCYEELRVKLAKHWDEMQDLCVMYQMDVQNTNDLVEEVLNS